jgi:anti-sigma regulatory factor (Ser/Thr protein kinase)
LEEQDAFYFMTDGLSEQLPPEHQIDPKDFNRTVLLLRTLSQHPDRHDDCCALCIKIKGKPSFPLRFQFERPREYQRIRNRIRNLLREFAPNDTGKIEVALGEALTNAMRESLHVELKISLFGSLLVVRVRDNGPGFAGNAKVAGFLATNREDSFSALLDAEGGRGILIMVAWMDRVIYNHRGNEVMLVKKC